MLVWWEHMVRWHSTLLPETGHKMKDATTDTTEQPQRSWKEYLKTFCEFVIKFQAF